MNFRKVFFLESNEITVRVSRVRVSMDGVSIKSGLGRGLVSVNDISRPMSNLDHTCGSWLAWITQRLAEASDYIISNGT